MIISSYCFYIESLVTFCGTFRFYHRPSGFVVLYMLGVIQLSHVLELYVKSFKEEQKYGLNP